MPFVIDKFKSKNGASVSENSPYLTEVQWDISVLPFVKNKEFLNLKRGLHRLVRVYTCQNATLLEITGGGSYGCSSALSKIA